MEKGKQFNVASGIEYAEGAVVSKTIIKESTGTITLFAFDKGQELSPHTAPFDALVQMMEGKATITVGGERAEMESGEASSFRRILLMPLKQRNRLKCC